MFESGLNKELKSFIRFISNGLHKKFWKEIIFFHIKFWTSTKFVCKICYTVNFSIVLTHGKVSKETYNFLRLSLGLFTADYFPTSRYPLPDFVERDPSNPCFGAELSLRSQFHHTLLLKQQYKKLEQFTKRKKNVQDWKTNTHITIFFFTTFV